MAVQQDYLFPLVRDKTKDGSSSLPYSLNYQITAEYFSDFRLSQILGSCWYDMNKAVCTVFTVPCKRSSNAIIAWIERLEPALGQGRGGASRVLQTGHTFLLHSVARSGPNVVLTGSDLILRIFGVLRVDCGVCRLRYGPMVRRRRRSASS